jgi:uncharacterized repeat protein (TIGR01451 family)
VEPLKTIWVDRTILPSDKLAPSFENKTIYASSDYLGNFAVVLLNESQAAGTLPANLEVSSTSSPNPVIMGDELTYTLIVKNKGSETASDVTVNHIVHCNMMLISATADQGKCRLSERSVVTVIWNLDSLAPGATATATLIVKLIDDNRALPKYRPEGGLPPNQLMVINTARVVSNSRESDFTDNQFESQTRVLRRRRH